MLLCDIICVNIEINIEIYGIDNEMYFVYRKNKHKPSVGLLTII